MVLGRLRGFGILCVVCAVCAVTSDDVGRARVAIRGSGRDLTAVKRCNCVRSRPCSASLNADSELYLMTCQRRRSGHTEARLHLTAGKGRLVKAEASRDAATPIAAMRGQAVRRGSIYSGASGRGLLNGVGAMPCWPAEC